MDCYIKDLPLEVLEDVLLKAKDEDASNNLKLARTYRVSKQFYNVFSTPQMRALIKEIKTGKVKMDPTSYGRFGMWMPEGCGYH